MEIATPREIAFRAAGGNKSEPEADPKYEKRSDPGAESKRGIPRWPVTYIPDSRHTRHQPGEQADCQKRATVKWQQLHVS